MRGAVDAVGQAAGYAEPASCERFRKFERDIPPGRRGVAAADNGELRIAQNADITGDIESDGTARKLAQQCRK